MPDATIVWREGLLPVLLQRRGGVPHRRAIGTESGQAGEACVSQGLRMD